MQTVVETPGYIKAAEAIFSEEERAAIIAMVASDPNRGDVMQGTGGSARFESHAAGWANGAVPE